MTSQSPEPIPEWALQRVCELTNADGSTYSPDHIRSGNYPATTSMGLAFARYIAQHEQAPVDPLLHEAREIASRDNWSPDYREQILAGDLDETPCVRFTLQGLCRGIELERADDEQS